MISTRSYILIFAGLAGILSYLFLRPEIDINAGGPILESKKQVHERTNQLASNLGFDIDSLAMTLKREQHSSYLQTLEDSLDAEVTPKFLNEQGYHIQSWLVILGQPKSYNSILTGPEDVFESTGNLAIRYDNHGNVIRMRAAPNNANPVFLEGENPEFIANKLIFEIFGYDSTSYERATKDGPGVRGNLPNEINTNNGNDDDQILTFKWESMDDQKPEFIEVSLLPVVREYEDEQRFSTTFGYELQLFVARDAYEPVALSNVINLQDNNVVWYFYIFFVSIFILTILVLSIGIRNVFKGKVEWRRALIFMGFITLGVFGWRMIYYLNTIDPFLSNVGSFNALLNTLLYAIAMGIYGAMAYISWEALARSQKQKQVDVIDALWQRKFFVKETGSAMIHGYAFGAIAVGIFSILIYLSGEVMLRLDSQFGFGEASISERILTINMSTWFTTWLVVVAQIGFVYSILNHWIKKDWLSSLIAIAIIGTTTAVLGRLNGTTAPMYIDIACYTGLAILFVYVLREYGILTVATGWWFFSVFFMIQPYIGSPSPQLYYLVWAQGVVLLIPFLYGLITIKYGTPVVENGEYIPEYEERMAQHLRVEKEIEIARESQYKLMPLKAPEIDGVDVFGFFLPSFEVGGDYYDYIVNNDDSGVPKYLNMTVVDVSGKSMMAAMPAVFTSGLLLSRMKGESPGSILSEVSEPIFNRTDKRTFITCIVARYDIQDQNLLIANAGHCKPILKRAGIAEFIETPEPKYPLGIKADTLYLEQEVKLKKGDFFFMYSDGLPEAVNEKGERFGFNEVPRMLEELDTENLSCQQITMEIKKIIQRFSNYQLVDDTTIICMKI